MIRRAPVTFRNPFVRTSQPPAVVAVIPARYASTRFPGKPLADIAGRPMIEHVYRRAAEARGVDAVVVATDDERIARGGRGLRRRRADDRRRHTAPAPIASPKWPPTSTATIVVNVQGDEPLLDPAMIAEVVEPLRDDAVAADDDGAPARSPIPRTTANPHVVKVVVDARGDALYFSRAPIPFARARRCRPFVQARRAVRLPPRVPAALRGAAADAARARRIARAAARARARLPHPHGGDRAPTRSAWIRPRILSAPGGSRPSSARV